MDDIKCEVTSGADWCQASYANEVLTIAVVSNHAYQSRTGTVTLVGGDIKATVTITQDGKGSSIGQVGDDLKIEATSAKASSHQPGEEIEKTLDGSLNTIFHSPWVADEYMPVTLAYHFEKVERMDYLVYHPRTDGGVNGTSGSWNSM